MEIIFPRDVLFVLDGLAEALFSCPDLRRLDSFTWNGNAVQVKGRFGAESLQLEVYASKGNHLSIDVDQIELLSQGPEGQTVKANFDQHGTLLLRGIDLGSEGTLFTFRLPGFRPDEE